MKRLALMVIVAAFAVSPGAGHAASGSVASCSGDLNITGVCNATFTTTVNQSVTTSLLIDPDFTGTLSAQVTNSSYGFTVISEFVAGLPVPLPHTQTSSTNLLPAGTWKLNVHTYGTICEPPLPICLAMPNVGIGSFTVKIERASTG